LGELIARIAIQELIVFFVFFAGDSGSQLPQYHMQYSSVFRRPQHNHQPQLLYIPSFVSSLELITRFFAGGDFAGQADVYASSGCPSTCTSACNLKPCVQTKELTDAMAGYVDNNPAAFGDAYFLFNSINIYQ
jgi:hypothetical protein